MDKQLLLKSRLPEADVDVPGVGTVRVRGLSRSEVMAAQNIPDPAARERRMLALGMVDPQLTEAEAGQWQQASPAGELEPVTTRIGQLSGVVDDAAKSGLPDAGSEPGTGVRALLGGEAEPDGDGAEGQPQ